MANIKISGLPAAGSASAAQEFETNDSGTSRKVTGAQLASYIVSQVDGSAVAAAGGLVATNNLSDVVNINTARSNLGLGTAATADTSAFATSAQGTLATTAVQPNTSPTFGTVNATSYTGDGSNLTGIAAGAKGNGGDLVFWENDTNVTSNYTITDGQNAMSAGPITINNGVTVTVGDGESWTVV